VVMRRGKVEESAGARELREHPRSPYVRELLARSQLEIP
jgi:ABC-type oligopeptide transport system ATPase subunit